MCVREVAAPLRVVLLLLQGLTGAEALPRVITMFFFDFLLRFSGSLGSGEMLLLTGRLEGSSLGLILSMDFLE